MVYRKASDGTGAEISTLSYVSKTGACRAVYPNCLPGFCKDQFCYECVSEHVNGVKKPMIIDPHLIVSNECKKQMGLLTSAPTLKPTAKPSLPSMPSKCVETQAEKDFLMWNQYTCAEMQSGWHVCTKPTDPNHSYIMTNCPATCAKALGQCSVQSSGATSMVKGATQTVVTKCSPNNEACFDIQCPMDECKHGTYFDADDNMQSLELCCPSPEKLAVSKFHFKKGVQTGLHVEHVATNPTGAAEDEGEDKAEHDIKGDSLYALQTTERSPISVATHGFAAIGFGFLLFGAYKHYFGKSEEFTHLEMA